MIDRLIKVLEFIFDFFWPNKLKEMSIRVKRLDLRDIEEVETFMKLYNESFPNDGSNYDAGELLTTIEDINNSTKHVVSDNIILVAKYRGSVVGFIISFYYPSKNYAIIAYLARSSEFKDIRYGYLSILLLNKLKEILLKSGCNLFLYELQKEKDHAKNALFRIYANKFDLKVYEPDFIYQRPKLNLKDLREEDLNLLIIPISQKFDKFIGKEDLMNILEFLHLYCYGDYYEKDDERFLEFQDYLKGRLEYYNNLLNEKVFFKFKI